MIRHNFTQTLIPATKRFINSFPSRPFSGVGLITSICASMNLLRRPYLHPRCLLAAAASLFLLFGDTYADELILPLRGDGFAAAQTFYQTSGHGDDCDGTPCPHDISATRWDTVAGTWTSTPPTPSTHPNPLSNHLMWNQAVYAPFDGEIVSCWRSMPDDDADGDDIRCPGGDEDGHSCARRGNHVVIHTDDGQLVTLAGTDEASGRAVPLRWKDFFEVGAGAAQATLDCADRNLEYVRDFTSSQLFLENLGPSLQIQKLRLTRP